MLDLVGEMVLRSNLAAQAQNQFAGLGAANPEALAAAAAMAPFRTASNLALALQAPPQPQQPVNFGAPGVPAAIQGPGFARELVLNLGRSAVGAGATATLSATTQRDMRFENLFLSGDGATDLLGFGVLDLKVGSDSLVNNSGAQGPASVYGVETFRSGLRGYTATAGMTISVTVVNNTAGALNISGSVTGWSLGR